MTGPVQFHAPAALQASPTLTMTLGVLVLVFLWMVANNQAATYWNFATKSGVK